MGLGGPSLTLDAMLQDLLDPGVTREESRAQRPFRAHGGSVPFPTWLWLLSLKPKPLHLEEK